MKFSEAELEELKKILIYSLDESYGWYYENNELVRVIAEKLKVDSKFIEETIIC